MKFCLKDKNGLVLLTNLSNDCIKCVNDCTVEAEKISCPVDKKSKRRGIKQVKENRVYICSNNSNDLASPKTFRKKFEPYIQLVQNFNTFRDQMVAPVSASSKRLVHNLVDLNAKTIQDLDYFFLKIYELNNYKDQLEHVKKVLTSNEEVDDLAEALLNILKREKLVKFEIATHNKIVNPTSRFDKNKSKHNLHKVFLNSFSLFSKSFDEFGVKVTIQPVAIEAFFDYQSVSVAITHLLNNAVKYSLENSELSINFSETKDMASITMNMISLRISDNDYSQLFTEGYSGEEAIKAKVNGDGIGMWMAKFIITKNKGSISIRRDDNKSLKKNVDGRLYENNVFEISLPKY